MYYSNKTIQSNFNYKMPRRLPVRPAKIIGNLFVLFVIGIISFIYYTFVFIVWGPRSIGKYHIL